MLLHIKCCFNLRTYSKWDSCSVARNGPGSSNSFLQYPAAPLCQPISACFYIWQLPRTFLCYCSRSVYRVHRGHTRTGTHMHANTHEYLMTPSTHSHTHHTASAYFSPAHSIFLHPPQLEVTPVDWTNGPEQAEVSHTATVATCSWVRCRKTTHAPPSGFPHLILCMDLKGCCSLMHRWLH